MGKHTRTLQICLSMLLAVIMTAFTVSASSDPPPHEGEVFKGWSMNDDEVNLYDAGTEIGMDNADEDYAVKLKAVYGEPPADVKYAVSIYGIQQDETSEPGKMAALTFGPAIDNNSFLENYRACEGTNETSPNRASDGHPCIHWMSWSEIIDQANTNPTVFQPCLENGCTHSVELRLSKKIRRNPFDTTGDGVTALSKYSIDSNYTKWNSESDATGGWPASRIRTTLNGFENCTPDTNPAVAGTDLLTQAESLISAFPPELQTAIVPKAVKSDTIYNDETNGNETTYDKLWLFSSAELISSDERPNEKITGPVPIYQRCQYIPVKFTFDEYGRGNNLYTRTLSDFGPDCIEYISNIGVESMKLIYSICISPGFCIGITEISDMPTAVLYEDNQMIFYEGKPNPANEAEHGNIQATYVGWNVNRYNHYFHAPWYKDKEKIYTVTFEGNVMARHTSYWFNDCTELKSFDGNAFNASNTKDMCSMFSDCTSLTSIKNINTWDTSNVTEINSMFSGCSALESLNINEWNTSKVINTHSMFEDCDKLLNLNISKWDVSSVENISQMFYGCKAIKSINLTNWNPVSAYIATYTFAGCSELYSIYAKDWTTNSNILSNGAMMFDGCVKLPGFTNNKVGGDMCKPQSMGGYFTDPE